jgi:hypothetical protein
MNSENSALALRRVIDQNRSEVERRWLARVQQDIARTPGVELTQLRDGLSYYLAALVQLLCSGQRAAQLSTGVGATSAWATVAREHGITRVRIGFDIAQLVHEFIVLRQVIREVAAEHGLIADGADALLSDILDAGISVAVQAYVDARDFDARRNRLSMSGFSRMSCVTRSPLPSRRPQSRSTRQSAR